MRRKLTELIQVTGEMRPEHDFNRLLSYIDALEDRVKELEIKIRKDKKSEVRVFT